MRSSQALTFPISNSWRAELIIDRRLLAAHRVISTNHEGCSVTTELFTAGRS
jgi:hypothetical protein